MSNLLRWPTSWSFTAKLLVSLYCSPVCIPCFPLLSVQSISEPDALQTWMGCEGDEPQAYVLQAQQGTATSFHGGSSFPASEDPTQPLSAG